MIKIKTLENRLKGTIYESIINDVTLKDVNFKDIEDIIKINIDLLKTRVKNLEQYEIVSLKNKKEFEEILVEYKLLLEREENNLNNLKKLKKDFKDVQTLFKTYVKEGDVL